MRRERATPCHYDLSFRIRKALFLAWRTLVCISFPSSYWLASPRALTPFPGGGWVPAAAAILFARCVATVWPQLANTCGVSLQALRRSVCSLLLQTRKPCSVGN